MKHKIALLLTALFLVAGLSWALMPAGEGTTYYVDNSYTGTEVDGTSAKPFKTINAALGALDNGDGYVTINIAAGTYKENVTISRGKVTLHGAGQDKTIIGGQDYNNTALQSVIIIDAKHVTISNLKVKSNGHTGTAGNEAATIEIKNASTEIDPNIIENVTVEQYVPTNGNNKGNGIYVGLLRTGTILRNITVSGHTNGIRLNASSTIENAVLKGNNTAEYGVKIDAGSATMSGISATGYTKAAISSNGLLSASTLTGSTLKESALGVEGVAGSLEIDNTSIYGKEYGNLIKINNTVITLGAETKLYMRFENYESYDGFFTYGVGLVRRVTDNGAQYFYSLDANYTNSRVVKVSDKDGLISGLKNAYPIELLATVFDEAYSRRSGWENTNLDDNDIVTLPAGDPITTKALNIYQKITLEGNNTTLKADAGTSTVPATDNVLVLNKANSTIQNLTITKAAGAAIVANQGVTLKNVTLTDNEIGMQVAAGRTATATNLTMSKNKQGGVELQATSSSMAKLAITGDDNISDLPAVFTNDDYYASPAVTTNEVAWTVVENTEATGYDCTHFWIRTLAKANVTLPKPTGVKFGEQLWNVVLTGGKVMYDGVEVQGEFQWANPRTKVNAADSYPVVFIPANQQKYAIITGLAVGLTPITYYQVTTGLSDRGKIMIENASADNYYLPGQVLKMIYVPYEGYKVNPASAVKHTVTVGTRDEEINYNKFGNTSDKYIFIPVSLETEGKTVEYKQSVAGGSVMVYNNGKPVLSGDKVYPGSILNVVVTPATGYALKSITYQYGTPVLNGLITVGSEPIKIETTMETQPTGTYKVTLNAYQPDFRYDLADMNGTVMLCDESGNIYMPGMAVPAGKKLTPTVTPAFGYTLESLNVLSGTVYTEIVNGVTKLTIDNNVTLVPEFEQVSYAVTGSMADPNAGSFRLYTTYPTRQVNSEQANGASITIAVSLNAGYALEAIIANGKELRITDWINYTASTTVNGETKFRVITRKKEDLKIDETQQVYTYYNEDVNYKFVAKAVTAGLESVKGFTIAYRDNHSTGEFSTGKTITAGNIYDVKVTRAADDYYNALEVVIPSGLKVLDNYLPLRNSTHTKQDPAKPAFADKATFDGTAFASLAAHPATSNNWVVTYRQDDQPIQYPVNAGVYDIIGFRAADTLYNAQTNVKLGTFTINKAAANASVTYATDVLLGQSLAASRLSGNAHIDGTFSWAAPETKMTKAGVITTNKAVFTPYSSNYTTDTNLATSLNVLAMAAGNLRTVTVNVTNSDKGSYTLTREAIDIAAGTVITAGERIRVSFETTDPAYTAVVTINGTQYPNGATYTVGATGDMVVDINFMLISQAPALIGITGINLSSLEKMVTEGDVFTLTPSITPANASDQRIFWSSTDSRIATVNADGKVTVHRPGTCEIIAETASGHSVSCLLTAFLTGSEEVLSGVSVTTLDKRYICIEAASSVKVKIVDVLGRMVYTATVNQRQLFDVPAGSYFVVVADQNSEATVKVVL